MRHSATRSLPSLGWLSQCPTPVPLESHRCGKRPVFEPSVQPTEWHDTYRKGHPDCDGLSDAAVQLTCRPFLTSGCVRRPSQCVRRAGAAASFWPVPVSASLATRRPFSWSAISRASSGSTAVTGGLWFLLPVPVGSLIVRRAEVKRRRVLPLENSGARPPDQPAATALTHDSCGCGYPDS
jgi:hypothetical protein